MGPGQRLRPCGGRFERDELQYPAVEASPGGMAVVIIVAVVFMRMFRMERGAGRSGAEAITATLRTMKDRCRQRALERQHSQQEENEEMSHGGRV